MTTDVRTQIFEAGKTRLTGLTSTGSNVFSDTAEDLPRQDSELPCLSLRIGPETAETILLGNPGEVQCHADFIVRLLAKSNSGLNNVIGTMSKEVKAAIASDDTFGGLASGGMVLTDTSEVSILTDAEHPVAAVDMTWRAQYYYLKNTPDVAR